MLIDNFSTGLLDTLVCPVSRERLRINGANLMTESAYCYPAGDFRRVSSATQSPEWTKGQRHYETYNQRWMARSVEFYRSVDAETAEVYREIRLAGSVLDVGGGYGLVTQQADLDPSQIVCVDPIVCRWSDVQEGPYKSHYARLRSIVRIPGYAEDLPFGNASFDTIHMRSCLDHFANPHRALLEARRVLKPAGKLVVGLALEGAFKLDDSGYVNSAKRRLKASFVGTVYEYFFDQHLFHPTEEALKCLLVSAGFCIDRWLFQPGYHRVVYLAATKSAVTQN
jgi:ubiquinone/menaquinone biosynthesis C-methylase UbiE